MNINHIHNSARGGSRLRLCVHTCLACVLLALYAIHRSGLSGELSTTPIIATREEAGIATSKFTKEQIQELPTPTSKSKYIRPRPKQPLLDHMQEGLSQQTKEILLSAARGQTGVSDAPGSSTPNSVPGMTASSSSSSSSHHQQEELPPLESLLSTSSESDPKIIGNVQFLLDFVVVGFGKCGTTSLLQWLQQKAEPSSSGSFVRAPNYEAQFLVKQRPAQLVRKMYQFAMEEREARASHKFRLPSDKVFKGFKNPSDIRRPKSRALLTKYWPQTPLIVTVRHPVEWLASIFNYFKIEKGRHKANLTAADMLAPGGRDGDGNTKQFVSTAKGEFHAMLAEVGKTPLVENSPEWDLLRPWLDPSQASSIKHNRMPNPVFFMEMKQLADSNTTRSKQFANDLEAFLGLPPNHLPPALHVRPNTDRVKLKTTDHLKMDICAPAFAPVLEEMVSISRSASLWFRQYFIQSMDVTVSSPDYIHELLEGWMVNPCD